MRDLAGQVTVWVHQGFDQMDRKIPSGQMAYDQTL